MKQSKSYSEKLKDPRWQKKRLEILKRDDFKCRCCESANKTLHVHHIWYPEKGKDIWEVDDCDLITLCEECHKEWHRIYDSHYSDIISRIVELFNKAESISIKKAMSNITKEK